MKEKLILPEDRYHPVRPDLPFLRHLTFAEGHAMEIGIGLAVLMYVSFVVGAEEAAFMVVLYVARFALGMKRRDLPPKMAADNKKENVANTMCDHTLGLHDIKSDPWYTIVSAIVTGAVLLAVFGVP